MRRFRRSSLALSVPLALLVALIVAAINNFDLLYENQYLVNLAWITALSIAYYIPRIYLAKRLNRKPQPTKLFVGIPWVTLEILLLFIRAATYAQSASEEFYYPYTKFVGLQFALEMLIDTALIFPIAILAIIIFIINKFQQRNIA